MRATGEGTGQANERKLKGNRLWNTSIVCGMLLLLVECAYCMRAASIACGMCLLLMECVYH